ncbi:MAG: 50S ribosomal protein L25 [Deltaproteobacteria bacterium]|jgi:large subunit ribosomal protein L25|nr:50S ribosomal protein L25 [Deltaproteobacteria bacterium]
MGLNDTLNAEVREVHSSNQAKRLRRNGSLPIVYYGHQLAESLSLTINYAEFKTAFLGTEGNRFLYTLAPSGMAPSPALLKDYQVDPVTRKVIHADFQKIDPQKPVTVPVPLTLVGKAAGVERGGQMQLGQREITVSGLPADIPSVIEADVTFLGLGQTMHLSQVKLPSTLALVKTADLPVAMVAVPKGLKAEADAASGVTAASKAAASKAATTKGDKKGADKKKTDKK